MLLILFVCAIVNDRLEMMDDAVMHACMHAVVGVGMASITLYQQLVALYKIVQCGTTQARGKVRVQKVDGGFWEI
jgi:hypothetical protein